VLALVLGDQAESAFRQSMLLSQGDISIFWSNWLVGIIMGLGVLLLLWPAVGAIVKMMQGSAVAKAGS
jgi:putative tricarboxylic transport membrane protein